MANYVCMYLVLQESLNCLSEKKFVTKILKLLFVYCMSHCIHIRYVILNYAHLSLIARMPQVKFIDKLQQTINTSMPSKHNESQIKIKFQHHHTHIF